MADSTHKAEVVPIEDIQKHPNADKLSIVKLFGGGFQVVVKTEDWRPGDFGIYVTPDSLVPLDRPEFSWLRDLGRKPYLVDGKEYHRVTAIKLRKAPSMGLLLPCDASHSLGDDVAAELGILHYDPPTRQQSEEIRKKTYGSSAEEAPELKPPAYDLENLRRFTDTFTDGEPVVVTEKIHGTNARFTWEDRGFFSFSASNWSIALRAGRRVISWSRSKGFKFTTLSPLAQGMRVGSRNQWKRPDPNDVWWKALEATPQIAKFCKNYPDHAIYGEVYGDVQDLDYGLGVGQVAFAAFDIYDLELRRFLDADTFFAICKRYEIPTAPVIAYKAPFILKDVLEMADGDSPTAGRVGKRQIREGVVVKPARERIGPYGRAAMKVVSQQYLERE